MSRRIEEVMTKGVQCVAESASVRDVALLMRDRDIGDVLVCDKAGKLCGIITDRDIAVRVIAEGKDPDDVTVGDVCSPQVVTLAPNATDEDAIRIMRDKAIRRVPVVDGDKPIGIVSIGDLAVSNDPKSALASISSASPNN